MINIECPQCKKQYSIPPDKFHKQIKVKLRCNICGYSFLFNVSDEVKRQSIPPNIPLKDDIASETGDATIIGIKFSKEGDTSPYFFPEDSKIFLTYKVGDKELKKHLNKRITLIGRTEGDIIINDPLISRKHACIEVKNSTMVELRDLESRNGTFHNEMRITSVFLQSGDSIRIGSTMLLYSNEIKFI